MKTEIKGKRSGLDFSEHELIVHESDNLLVHFLKKPGSYYDSIKYINTNGIMAVTGDYGNWIFCREFHPSATGGVSGQYWCEKLSIASTQKYKNYDPDATRARIMEELNGGLEEYGYEGNRLEEMKEYLNNCLNYVDDELEYTQAAYRESPSFMDSECVIFVEEINHWLKVVFDGFDEICRRMKEQNENKLKI